MTVFIKSLIAMGKMSSMSRLGDQEYEIMDDILIEEIEEHSNT